MPFTFERKISLGNIIAIITMIAGLWGFAQAYGGIVSQVDNHTQEIEALQRATAEAARAAEADRLFFRETLAEVRTDVGYLRRAEEENRRQQRANSTGDK